jgi:hypothetical protein
VNGTSAIAQSVQHLQELADHAFVRVRELDGAARRGYGGSEVVFLLSYLGERARGPRGLGPDLSALSLQPLLEARRFGRKKPFEKVAAIQLEGLAMTAAGLDVIAKRGRIAPQRGTIGCDFSGTTTDDHARTKFLSQKPNCLIEGRAGAMPVEIRPEECEKGVTAVKPR